MNGAIADATDISIMRRSHFPNKVKVEFENFSEIRSPQTYDYHHYPGEQ